MKLKDLELGFLQIEGLLMLLELLPQVVQQMPSIQLRGEIHPHAEQVDLLDLEALRYGMSGSDRQHPTHPVLHHELQGTMGAKLGRIPPVGNEIEDAVAIGYSGRQLAQRAVQSDPESGQG